MRTWSTYFLALLFLAGCSTSSTTGVSDVSDGDLDVRSRDDLPPTDMSPEVDTHSDTKPDEVEVTDPCAPPAAYLCPCEEGKDCLSGFCELHLGEMICTEACVEECPAGYGCVQYSAGGPDAGHVCMSVYPSLCVSCEGSNDCHGDDDCFVHGPEAGAFCSPWCGEELACHAGFTCAALDTVTGVPGFACVPDEGECACSTYSVAKHKSTVCEVTNEWGTCGGARICELEGLSPCSAPIPEEELCGDGVYNDCDGFTDPVVLCHDCECGDGECDPACGEDVAGDDFCPADCCLCGDGVCDPDPCGEGWEEGLKTCAPDCAVCGDDICDPAEGPVKCPEDCPQDCEPFVCGNGTCEPGEGPTTCPDDCGSACGNCVCEGGESYDTCPVDCGFCGDGFCISKCDYNEETPGVCDTDCPVDCDPTCDEKDCGADGCGGTCGICTGQDKCIQGVCICQPACDGKECGEDGCGGVCGACEEHYTCDEGTCVYQPWCGDGTCDVALSEDCSTCSADCPCSCGETCDAGTCTFTACNWKECGDDSCGGSCGTCGDDEYCDTGLCQPLCGNGLCVDPGEDCVVCPADCGCDPDLEECTEVATGGWVCAAKMVEIPAGNFWMGCNNCEGSAVNDGWCGFNEHPYHEVYLDAFEIDQTEVTADQYAVCESAGGCTVPGTGNYSTWQEPGMGDHPINYVTWYQAEGYCLWAGKELCTEAQWEKGARGGCEENGGPSNCKAQSRKYPWGNDMPTCALAVKDGCDGDTQNVCSLSPAGDSPYGVCDMAGNVWEWVADRYQKDYYCDGDAASGDEVCTECGSWPGYPAAWSNPEGPGSGSYGVGRGSCFADNGGLRVSGRLAGGPSDSYPGIGVRCCRSE